MAKAANRRSVHGAKRSGQGASKAGAGSAKVIRRTAGTRPLVVSKARFEAVLRAAERSGLLGEKTGRIAGRVSSALVAQAKLQTGIETDTDLIEFALATIALEDDFAQPHPTGYDVTSKPPATIERE